VQILLNAIPWPAATPVGLCVAFTWLIITGRLVPRSTVKTLAAEQAERIAYMETTASEQRSTISTLVEQNAELSVSGRLSVALLQSLQGTDHAGSLANPGSGHVAPSTKD
jgi:hypothetical protein